jgi:hypothetical protein
MMSGNETFQHIGPRVAFGTAQISSDEAEHFRQVALQGSKVNKLRVSDDETLIQTSAYTNGLLSDAVGDYDVYSMAFYAKSILGSRPDFWRSTVTFARFNDKHRDTKIYNIYEVETHGGEVAIATRRVRVIRNLSRIAFDDDGNPFEDVYSRQRKAFERVMTTDDIHTVDQSMKRLLQRQQATGSR